MCRPVTNVMYLDSTQQSAYLCHATWKSLMLLSVSSGYINQPNGLFTAHELNWTKLTWTDLQQFDPVTRRVHCSAVTTWLAASKFGRLLLSQFWTPSTWHYPHLLLSAGVCYRSISPGRGRSAANPPAAVAAVDRWIRQTHRRTDGRSSVT